MKPDSQSFGAALATADEEGVYASQEEAERGINALTDADFVKLMLIAHSFCRHYGISSSVMEPEELLSEAMMKTLQWHKKWKKSLSMVKHLDRAMQNIIGHVVAQRCRRLG